jgi:two-component sensor histidine kinase
VKVELDMIPVSLPSKQATALALAVNELVSNAAKHAFAGRRHGRLEVCLSEEGGRGLLWVKDDGPGLPSDFDIEIHANVGLQVVASLAESTLGGSLELLGTQGLRAEVRFQTEDLR